MEFIYKAVKVHSGISVFAGIGERIREGHELWQEMVKAGVMDRSVMVFGQMNEAPGARFRTGLSAMTMAEYFRDRMGKDVLFLMDNVFRFVQAGNEVSTLLGRLPSRVGYQPTLTSELAELEERITSTAQSSITSVQAIYVPADDITDPACAGVFPHLDTFIVLSREIAGKGLYPAIDPLLSRSKLLEPDTVGDTPLQDGVFSKAAPRALQGTPGHNSHAGHRGTLPGRQAYRLQGQETGTLPYPAVFSYGEVHRGAGVNVPLTDTIDGCERIMSGEMDALSEESFFMTGALPKAHELNP